MTSNSTSARRKVRLTERTEPQRQFWASEAKFRAFVGGVGSGKTFAGCVEALRPLTEGTTGMVLAPTYPMLRDSTLRTFLDLAQRAGALLEFNKAEMRAEIEGSRTILFRSADRPDRLRGPNLGWFWLDEAALMPREVWLIMIGRLRLKPGKAWVTTTPRGKNWLYHQFARGGSDYAIVRASSRTNPYLPGGFVGSLDASYGATFRAQEIEGEFVDDLSESILPDAWLECAGGAAPLRAGPVRMALDLAEGSGGDPAGILVRDDNGVIACQIGQWSLEATASKAALWAERYDVHPQRITFDASGVGSDFRNRLDAVGLKGANAYKGGSDGGPNFSSLRTAAAWAMRQRIDPKRVDARGSAAMQRQQFAIAPELLGGPFGEELRALRYSIDKERKKALEPKDELIASLGRSPTYADLMIMSFAYPHA